MVCVQPVKQTEMGVIMHKLACPKCHKPIIQMGNSYKCDSGHCYDIAKSKYLNLLLNPDKATNNPGDSKESLVARKAYLTKGYYDIILNNVIACIKKYRKTDKLNILDLGCGEGYYTAGLKKAFHNDNIYGLDISKEAINMATKYTKDVYWLVGNSKNLPIIDHSLDFITALFTVVNQNELKRVLKPGGYVIHVTANPNHLIEIKHLIYDEIKIKSDKYIRLDLKKIESYDLIHHIKINNREDSLNLLKMTPHYYHIKKERRNVLNTLQRLDITIDIKITIYST